MLTLIWVLYIYIYPMAKGNQSLTSNMYYIIMYVNKKNVFFDFVIMIIKKIIWCGLDQQSACSEMILDVCMWPEVDAAYYRCMNNLTVTTAVHVCVRMHVGACMHMHARVCVCVSDWFWCCDWQLFTLKSLLIVIDSDVIIGSDWLWCLH